MIQLECISISAIKATQIKILGYTTSVFEHFTDYARAHKVLTQTVESETGLIVITGLIDIISIINYHEKNVFNYAQKKWKNDRPTRTHGTALEFIGCPWPYVRAYARALGHETRSYLIS